jgi:hypothetical protein
MTIFLFVSFDTETTRQLAKRRQVNYVLIDTEYRRPDGRSAKIA